MEWIIFFGVCSICFVLHRLIVYIFLHNEVVLSQQKRIILGWTITILVIGSWWVYTENTSIKDSQEYYVNLFPAEDSQKNYRVPGLIYKEENGYNLAIVYWSNGGETTFDGEWRTVVLGEKVKLKDDEGKEWYVELTKTKVK